MHMQGCLLAGHARLRPIDGLRSVEAERVRELSGERGPTMRLTVDVPSDNHARFKALCALRKTKIAAEINAFIQRRLDDVEKPGV